jgi:hypothetical protein
MELTQILIIVGVIGAVVLVIVAIRGSFKNDDAFYGESPPTVRGDAASGDSGKEQVPTDGGPGADTGGSGDGVRGGDGD